MFSVASALGELSWRLVVAAAVAGVLVAGGCRFGENRVTVKWDQEKAATAKVVFRQAEHVAAVAIQQTTINQEISNEFQKTKAAIAADRQHLFARVPVRVRVDAPGSYGSVPKVPIIAVGAIATAADPVPVAGQSENSAACERLAEDAAQTTLMVVEFQRWYREQETTLSKQTN